MTAPGLLATWRKLGPYCEVEGWTAGHSWRPLRELVDSPAVLSERVQHARAYLAARSRVQAHEIEERVAASIVFLGIAARFSTPLLAAAVIHQVVPVMSLDSLWWRPVDSGPLPIAWDGEDIVAAGRDELGRQLAAQLAEVTDPLVEAFATTFALSRQILWGNVTSSLGGALTVLAAAEPELGVHAGSLVADVLDRPPFAGTAQLRRASPDLPHRQLVRSSCCLFYRIPQAGTCGDCVLNAR